MCQFIQSNKIPQYQFNIIVACAIDGTIGLNNSIPWNYKGDLKLFKEMTIGGTIIMGRNTFESIKCKPLIDRRNIVISSTKQEGVETYPSIMDAMSTIHKEQVWFIGGRQIYMDAMKYAGCIYMTQIPYMIYDHEAVCFPTISHLTWRLTDVLQHPYCSSLRVNVYQKNKYNLG